MTTVTLVEIAATHPVTAAVRHLRAGTAPLRSGAADTPANAAFGADLADHPTFEWSLFGPGRTRGPSSVSWGALKLNNVDGRYDWLAEWLGGRWTATVWTGEGGRPFSAYTRQMTGRCGFPRLGEREVVVPLRDPLAGFRNPLHLATYAGDNVGTSGNEGGEELAGKAKPTCLGYCLQVPGALVNAPGQRVQVHDGAIAAVVQAYAAGNGAAHTVDAATGIATYTVGVGELVLTQDVRGHAAGGYLATIADLIVHLATSRAGFDPADIDGDDVAALNAACPEEVGFFSADAGTTAQQAADLLAASKRVWWLPDQDGRLRMGQLAAPSGEPVGTIRPEMLVAGSDRAAIEIVPPADAVAAGEPGLPPRRLTVRGVRHWRTLGRDQVADILGEERKADLGQEWREATVEAATPVEDAPEIVVETALTTIADLEAERDALWALLDGTVPEHVRVRVATRHVPAIRPGQVWALRHDRYGLGAGPLFVVMRRLLHGGETTLDLWRPRPVGE